MNISALFTEHAVKVVRVEGGRKPQHVNVLTPHLAWLLALMIEKASISAYWKEAKLSPLFKKGPVLDQETTAC